MSKITSYRHVATCILCYLIYRIVREIPTTYVHRMSIGSIMLNFIIWGNFLAVTCPPNVLLMEENTVSAIHLYP
jgi:hypothetical protein